MRLMELIPEVSETARRGDIRNVYGYVKHRPMLYFVVC